MEGFPQQFSIGTVKIAPATVLAPMAGVTDTVFRRFIRNLGGCGLIMTEFTSSHGVSASLKARKPNKTLKRYLNFDPDEHPILRSVDTGPLFSLSRSVDVVEDDTGGTSGVAFLHTSASSWTTTDTSVLRSGAPQFVSGRDRPGPITVGIEVAFRTVTPPGAEPQQGRVIAYGTSRFATNAFIEYLGNKDLFVNTVAWLARQPESMGQRPRQQQLGYHQFFVSNEQGDTIFWTTAVLEPALFALIGIVVAIRRRRD